MHTYIHEVSNGPLLVLSLPSMRSSFPMDASLPTCTMPATVLQIFPPLIPSLVSRGLQTILMLTMGTNQRGSPPCLSIQLLQQLWPPRQAW